jgi:2-iminobutanoate/2-iminopropanoate deaminase
MSQAISPNPETDSKLSYSQAILTEGHARTLFVSGQVGVAANGTAPDDFESQVRQAWANLLDVLAVAGMKVTDLTKISAFLTNADDYAAYAAIRGEFLGDHKPASTLLIVSALARPGWKFEVEAIASTPR